MKETVKGSLLALSLQERVGRRNTRTHILTMDNKNLRHPRGHTW